MPASTAAAITAFARASSRSASVDNRMQPSPITSAMIRSTRADAGCARGRSRARRLLGPATRRHRRPPRRRASSSDPRPTTRTTTWTGRYRCAQGITGITLSLEIAHDGATTGVFAFSAVPENPTVPSGSYRLRGTASRLPEGGFSFDLQGESWIDQPQGYNHGRHPGVRRISSGAICRGGSPIRCAARSTSIAGTSLCAPSTRRGPCPPCRV